MTQQQAERARSAGPRGDLGRNLALGVFSVILFFTAAELIARGLLPSPAEAPDAPTHREHEQLIVAMGLPALNETMEYSPRLLWRLKDGLDDFPVRGSIRGHPIDFSVSTRNHLRSPALSATKQKLRVLAVGDSTTFGLGVADDATWPSQLQRRFDRSSLDVEVINAGVPGYTSFQCRRFLEDQGLALEPDLIVATFGFNDFDRWATNRDTEAARAVRLRAWDAALMKSRLYQAMHRVLGADGVVPWGGRTEAGSPGGAARPAQASTTRLTLEEYIDQVRAIKESSDELGIPLILLLWPAEIQVRTKHHRLEDHQAITFELAGRLGIETINLVERFIRSGRSLFLDRVHANAAGLRITAESVYLEAAPLLERAARGD
jgi:lysophospholipase L1-like esterase